MFDNNYFIIAIMFFIIIFVCDIYLKKLFRLFNDRFVKITSRNSQFLFNTNQLQLPQLLPLMCLGDKKKTEKVTTKNLIFDVWTNLTGCRVNDEMLGEK